jgi:flavin-binding protein dodecin
MRPRLGTGRFTPEFWAGGARAGTSKEGLDDAIRGAVTRAAKTLRNLDWFNVTDIRGHIDDDQVCHYQVTLKVGFRLEEPS